MKLNAKFDDQAISVTHFTSIQNYCELYRMNRVLGGNFSNEDGRRWKFRDINYIIINCGDIVCIILNLMYAMNTMRLHFGQ